MHLSNFLDPVELEKPDELHIPSKEVFPRSITINTDNGLLEDLEQFDIAILGVPEERNSLNKGTTMAPNNIRSELYKLISPVNKKKIVDLGNIKLGNTFTDTYFALKEVTYQLLCNNITLIIMGGSQELTVPLYQALENYQEKINLAVVDSRIDAYEKENTDADSYLADILENKKLFKFINLGHQTYLTENRSLELLTLHDHTTIRLGDLRANLQKVEPVLRDMELLSFDMGAIRQSDAPGHFRPSPNGLYAEESCQITRYAGTSDKLRIFGLFETNSRLDNNNHSAALAAQMIWYFIDGFEFRIIEIPYSESQNFKMFIVGHNDLDHDMIFYKSMLTNRWWLQVPDINNGQSVVVACSHDDYEMACNHEVPEIWWETYYRLN